MENRKLIETVRWKKKLSWSASFQKSYIHSKWSASRLSNARRKPKLTAKRYWNVYIFFLRWIILWAISSFWCNWKPLVWKRRPFPAWSLHLAGSDGVSSNGPRRTRAVRHDGLAEPVHRYSQHSGCFGTHWTYTYNCFNSSKVDQFEAEIESLVGTGGKKKKGKSDADARTEECQSWVRRRASS